MKIKPLYVLTLILTTGLAAHAVTDNRSQPAPGAIFNEPATAIGQQIMLGLGEMLAGKYLLSPLTAADKLIANHAGYIAEKEFNLLVAEDLPVSITEKATRLEMLTSQRMAGEKSLIPNAKEMQNLEERIRLLRSADIVTVPGRLAAVDLAKLSLVDQRMRAISAAQEIGLFDKSIRVLQKGTVILFAADASSRVYIWNALDANPTLAPAAAFLKNFMK